MSLLNSANPEHGRVARSFCAPTTPMSYASGRSKNRVEHLPKSLGASLLMVLIALIAAETILVAWKWRLDLPGLASALLGATFLQIWTCRSRLELLATAAAAVGLAFVRFGFHLRPLWENPGLFWAFLGLASLFVMGTTVASTTPCKHPDRPAAFGVALAIPLSLIVASVMLPMTAHMHRATFDTVLCAFDGSLGLQPSFVLGRLLKNLRWLDWVSRVAYQQVPAAMAILYGSTLGAKHCRKPNLVLVFCTAKLVGYLLYAVVPAAGPLYLFASRFPDSAPRLAGLAWLPAALPTDSPRNAMPSLHMTWAVLLCWNARKARNWLRAGFVLFLLLTVLITLGSGEHYLIDLVVAMPFALAIQAAFIVPVRELPVSLPFWGGSVATLAWLAFLRFAAPVWLGSVVLDWSLVMMTVVGSVIMEQRANREFRVRQSSQDL